MSLDHTNLTARTAEIEALLAEASARDIRIWTEDGQLRFSAAKGALTDELRHRLSGLKSEIIAHLSEPEAEAIKPLPPDGEAPLSFAQQRLWFLEQMGDIGAAYTLPLTLELRGKLDVPALEAAIIEVVRRHQVLRTVFRAANGHPKAVLLPARGFRLIVEDLTDAEDALDLARYRLRRDAERPFDLANDLLLRGRLVRLADDHHLLALTAHHAAADGWSLSILGEEISAAYRRVRGNGSAEPPPGPAIQYSDYAAWQREHLQGAELERRIARWRSMLDGAPTILDMPTDKVRPAAFSYRGDRKRFTIPAETARRIEALAREHGATPYFVLFAAFAVLLHRIGGPEDMLVGTTVANRARPELENLIGLFVNTLPLRVDASGDPAFTEVLARVRAFALDALELQDTPFEALVDALGLERHLSHAPLVQTMFTFLNAPPGRLDLGNVEVRDLPSDPGISQFDLSLTLEADGQGGLNGFIDYATDLFDETTAARWATYYPRLLAAITDAPETPVSALPLLTEEERLDLLQNWRGPDATVPDRLVHEAFAETVRERPNAPALTMGETTLTYAELDARAERLAQRIAAHLDGPEAVVGICLERSVAQITAVLATFKAGGICVPMDPHYPEARIAYILEDSGAPVVVGKNETLAALSGDGIVVIDPDAEDDDTPTDTLRPTSAPGTLAYLIYTSGTTGNPKAVAVEHGPFAAHIPAIAERYHMRGDDRFLQAASLNFDLSWEQIFVTFGAGAELVLLPPGTTDPVEILTLARNHALTILNLPPALWLPMVRTARETPALIRDLPLRLMIVGSEEMPVEGVPLWRELGTGVPLMNSYGPTEAVITSAMFDLPDEGPVGVRVPIGHPVAGHLCYILDKRLEPVPVGVPGELYVGGLGLARGYLNRPDLTDERFVADPFVPGGRIYKTGDLTRWRPDGAIEFLGRMDRQIKLRGFRIEPGEIESALLAHKAVESATVILRDETGRPRLIGYCVCPGGMPPTEELRGFLAARLPDYMVPSALVAIDRIPLMPNGKIDRNALPEPDSGPAEATQPPRTGREKALAAIWEEVLERKGVGIADNFFELGGDSMVSTLVASRARQAGIVIGPRDIFRFQTVAELAAFTESVTDEEEAPPSAMEPEDGIAPLTPIQTSLLARKTEGSHYFTQNLVLTLPAGTSSADILAALTELTSRHGALRTVFREQNGIWIQEIGAPPTEIDLREIDLSDVSPDDRVALRREAETGAQESIRLEFGLPWMAVLFRHGRGEADRLFLAFHHLIVDAVSLRILVEDFTAGLSGTALPTDTAPWAQVCRHVAALPAPLEELEFWTPSSPVEPLPRDIAGSKGAGTEGKTETITTTFDPATTEALLRGANTAYRTRPPELLLAGLLRAFSGWTGSPRLNLALEGHGRDIVGEAMDVSRTVGWFTAVHPLRLHAQTNANAGTLVRAVKEQTRAVPGNGTGYGLLRWLSSDPDVRETLAAGDPEIAFNYLGRIDAGGGLPGDIGIEDAAASARGPDMARPYLIEIDAFVAGNALTVNWAYWKGAHNRATIDRLAARFEDALKRIVEHCLDPVAGGYTPSDFPLAGIDQAALDRIIPKSAEIEDIFPLSPLQQGMLFHAQFDSQSRLWFEQMVNTLSGPVSPEILQSAWTDLCQRHPAFRSHFVWHDVPRPLQVVRRDIAPDWHFEDVSGLTPEKRDARIDAFVEADRKRGFDLAAAPLTRLALFRLDDTTHRLIWSVHHAIVDGFCQSIVLRDLIELYRARASGSVQTLPPSGRYRDFVGWLAERDSASDEAFWRAEIGDIDEPVAFDLGLADVEKAGEERDFRDVRGALSLDLSERLRAFARDRHLTLNTVVQGAWTVVLSRYLGSGDVLFGSVVSGRPAELPAVNDTIGLFVNTLPIRDVVPNDMPAADWLAKVQARNAEREAHGYVSLVDIQGWSAVPRGMPLFETLFAFENLPAGSGEEKDLPVRLAETDVTVEEVNYPLMLQVVPEDSLQIKVSFDASRYPARAAEAVIGHLETVLRGIVERPEAPPAALPLATGAERAVVTGTWNNTARPYGYDLTVGRRMTIAAERWADRIAVTCGAESLTYRELEARSNRLAHRLQNLGIGRDVAVGIMVERGVNLLVALAGAYKSGGCYVPLDPLYPPDRIAMMLEDADVRAIVTEAAMDDLLPPIDVPRIRLDMDDLSAEPDEPPANGPAPDDLAYVMFTSGSTGRPKGVMIRQRSVAGFCDMMTEITGMGPETRVLAVTTVSFDVSLGELVHPLTVGARIEVATREEVHDPALLIRRIGESDATFMQATPATWRMLIGAGWTGKPDLTLISGGEPLSRDLAEDLKARAAVVWNGYGPTEATVWGLCQRIDGGHRDHLAPNAGESIGRPMPNYRAYVLDAALNPLPPGVTGELYLGGPPLARGYIGQPEMTAERFLPDPFLGGEERIYRTGDLARWLPDGRIEYLGRVDTQVKIRGFRIELGEIEAVLRDHPAINDAAVQLFGAGDDARLVAYVSPDPAGLGTLGEPDGDETADWVDQWRTTWESTYGHEKGTGDLAFDIRSWRDSRTGQSFAEDDMREWVDNTVARIQALKPRRVLEIGCGTGLLLARIAPDCERYAATDLSSEVVAQVERLIAETPALANAEVACTPAHDLSRFEPGSFDAVVINSTIQYFPDANYLMDVLAGAAEVVRDGGAIFVGDVRHAGLLDVHHLFALLPSAPDRMPVADFAKEWRRRIGAEEELLADPGFFTELDNKIPRLSGVDILVKAGRADTEMNRFRYDAVLRIGESGAPAAALDWDADGWQERLEREKPDAVIVRGIANGRLTRLIAGLDLLDQDRDGPVETLRHRFTALPGDAPQPQDIIDAGQALGYDVALSWNAGERGRIDAAFHRGGAATELLRRTPERTGEPGLHVESPLRRARLARLPDALRLHTQTVLPDYMVPALVRVMDPLPLTGSGKVDRRRLPEPDLAGETEARKIVRPRTPVEEILCELYADVLGLKRAGVDEDFFRLGGHSLLATQLAVRASAATGREVSVRWLFEAPTPAALAARIEAASETPLPPITKSATTGPVPASFAQRRLWFLEQMDGSGGAYNMPGAFRLKGDLDIAALETAFAAIVRRHAALRTRFVERDGEPMQEILPPAPVPIVQEDLSQLPPAAREMEVQRRMHGEAQEPFDLGQGPLIRVRLLRLGANEHVLLATMHHIVSDGWSIGVLGRELPALYTAETADLPELPVSYADFAQWQNGVLDGDRLTAEIEHWRQRLDGAPAVLTLPTKHPRREGVAFPAGHVPIVLPAPLMAKLKKLSRTAGATLFMTLLSGYAALLGRWAGQDDVVVGTPVANRTRIETEGLIGFFVNTLALRTGNMEGLDVLGLIRRLRDVALDAFAHQDVPFERLVEDLRPARSTSHSPLFQTMFVFQNIPEAPVSLPGLTLEPLEALPELAKFDLTLILEGRGDTVGGRLEFNAELIGEDNAQAFAEQLIALYGEMAEAPNGEMGRIPLVSGTELRTALTRWSDGGTPLRDKATVLDLLAERVKSTPAGIALDDGTTCISFAELVRLVEDGARDLVKRSVKPGDRMAIALERGTAQVIAFLAALRAGAVAVPLDPTHPESRRDDIIGQAGAHVVVDAPLGGAEADLPAPPSPDDAAYAVFTSGSTGKPKGVLVGHAGLANLGAVQAEGYGLMPGRRMLQVVSPAFDVAVGQIATFLASGATLCFAPAEDTLPGPGLSKALAERRISHLEITPSMLAALPAEPKLPDLAVLILGGESCPHTLIREWAPGRRLINAYGPTEATVCATIAEIDPESDSVPIGKPFPGVRTYVVDPSGEPVPPGVVGELWIGGIGVAHGYLGDEELTQARFLADPFSEAGGRIYRTGDLVRRRTDGQIEFVGRADGQVKLRGVRIELAEIEAVLKDDPAVADAAADVRGETLVAWVASAPGRDPDARMLRERARTCLPEAMVPAAIGTVEAIPYTTSGKIDRKALTEPKPEPGTAAGTPPRDATETGIAEIWHDLLGHDGAFDIGTSFFDLGGHSLLATRMISRLRDRFGAEVPLRTVFADPTIAGIARTIQTLERDVDPSATDGPIRPSARRKRSKLAE